jgi:hypothetical protein
MLTAHVHRILSSRDEKTAKKNRCLSKQIQYAWTRMLKCVGQCPSDDDAVDILAHHFLMAGI